MTNQINFKTKEAYTNGNAITLASVQQANPKYSNEWLTFLQAKELNKQIIKGSKGITLQRVINVTNKQGKEEQRVTRFTVFNTMQTKEIECSGKHDNVNDIISCIDCSSKLEQL